MITPFRKVQVKTDNHDLKNLQDAVSQVFNQILTRQIIDGILIPDLVIATGLPVSISHGLGNAPRGWIIIKKNAQADIWETVSDTPNATMSLNSSANVTISLWVF